MKAKFISEAFNVLKGPSDEDLHKVLLKYLEPKFHNKTLEELSNDIYAYQNLYESDHAEDVIAKTSGTMTGSDMILRLMLSYQLLFLYLSY